MRALAARDGFAFALMWETGLRGVIARTARLSEWTLPDQPQVNVSVYLRANASASFTHPGILQVKPHHTKTAKHNLHGIMIQPAARHILDLWFCNSVMAAMAGQPLQDVLVRTTQEPPAVRQLRLAGNIAVAKGPMFL